MMVKSIKQFNNTLQYMSLLRSDKGLFNLFLCTQIIFSMLLWISFLINWTEDVFLTNFYVIWVLLVAPLFALLSLRLDKAKRLITGFQKLDKLYSFLAYFLLYNIAGMLIHVTSFEYVNLTV